MHFGCRSDMEKDRMEGMKENVEVMEKDLKMEKER